MERDGTGWNGMGSDDGADDQSRKGSVREPQPLENLTARYRFTQKANDLFFGKSLLHVQSPVCGGIGLQA